MAFTATTLSSKVATTDRTIVVASATGFSAGYSLRIGSEMMVVQQGYTSGTTIPVLRGRDGTVTAAHVSGEAVIVGIGGSDFAAPQPAIDESVTSPSFALAGSPPVYSYTASGAITVTPGIHKLVGTGTLAMTLASPTADMDGWILIVCGDGKSASTLTIGTGTVGAGNAGTNYKTATFQNAGNVALMLMALNGFWTVLPGPVTGTSTAISWAISS